MNSFGSKSVSNAQGDFTHLSVSLKAAALTDDLIRRAAIAAEVARQNATDVDRNACFPTQAFAKIREQGLLGIMVPRALGGEQATMSQVAEVCYTLAQGCASTGMIFAMHQVKVACIVEHGLGVLWHDAILQRLHREQLLFASSTTEGLAGGNVRSSIAPILSEGVKISLNRDASCISYGAEADGIVTTARRAPDAEPSDQVLAVFLKNEYTLTPSGSWDTLGMRGTCSAGFNLKAHGVAAQILPGPYERIHSRTMVPAAHLLWSSTWAGVAASAVRKAEAFVRRAARGTVGQMAPGAAHLTNAKASLLLLRNLIATSLKRYEEAHGDETRSAAFDYQSDLTLTKVQASELALQTVLHCYRTCGLSGYRNDSDVTIGLHLRDILSSPIMINNDRILASMDGPSMMSGVPKMLGDK